MNDQSTTDAPGMYDEPDEGLDLASPQTEEGQGLTLAMQLVTASMDSNFRTMDALYEDERQRRMALEVLLDVFLDHADAAYMGTVRQYEEAIDILRFKGRSGPHINLDFNGSNWIEVLSKRHPEYREQS